MNVFEVKTIKKFFQNGKVKQRTVKSDIAFPSVVDEITFKMWDTYFQMKETDPDWLKEMEKKKPDDQMKEMGTWSEKRWAEYYSVVLKYLSCFTDAEILTYADAPLLGDPGNSLVSIYFYLIGLINSYEPTPAESFEYKGDTYVIDKVEVDRFGRTHYGKNMTANQVIDALQYEHIFNVKDEQGKPMIKDRKYQIDIALMAVLSKKVLSDGSLDERPLDYIERQEWTEAKIKHFADAPMTIALDVDFFLRNLKQNSLTILIRGHYLKRGKSLLIPNP